MFWRKHPLPPGNLHEYQREGLAKFAFHKPLILKSALLVVLEWQKLEMGARKKKSGSKAPALPRRSYLRE
jgi:hypothetical protein